MPQTPDSHQSNFDDARRRADEFAREAYADVFERVEHLWGGGPDVNVPIVSAIIERG
jgi:hypothetical protein